MVIGEEPKTAEVEWGWYVIHAQTRKEMEVEMALRQQGLETFLPIVTVPSRRRDRKVTLHVPLFPGYLFINARLDTRTFHQVIKAHHVFRLLGNGRPTTIPEEEVEGIKAIVSGERLCYPWRFLEKGKKVRVIDGPLSGVEGIILERREQKRRLVVGVELFRRSVAVELENEAVEQYS
jgi:transcription termination/antitermination protein NusG